MPDEDDLADKYLAADERLTRAGMHWYEVSNWARQPESWCRHNLLYWTGGHWWGVGPGAHSHIGGVRWWNVKHPAAYAERLALVEGLPVSVLEASGRAHVARLVDEGLVDLRSERLVLTQRGRLLADGVVRDLVGDPLG